ncbi:483_t:CDS:1 [Paraglomus occultum]|uniref:483_t:CDS:1 n=1 Tax=Paraglomus occultum TaxID=144539 RepID=A0A9N9CNJ0_9GLOM|nr:483_t:CDS:1 [Paraglomus occultum]
MAYVSYIQQMWLGFIIVALYLNLIVQVASISYDGQKAVDYALTYCCNPNTNSYPFIEDDDCTDFASQVLQSGGIPQSNDWWCESLPVWNPCLDSIGIHRTADGKHCSGDYAFSTSWSVVGDLHDYLINNNLATDCSLDQLQPGDLIQYYDPGKQVWEHTAVIIYSSPTNPTLAYHSTNRCNSNHNYVLGSGFSDYRGICINSHVQSKKLKRRSVPGNGGCD